MNTENDYIFFWKPGGPNGELSQWFYSPFILDGYQFATAQQCMMHTKVKMFNDYEMMNDIATTPSYHPAQHKKMGRMVRGFDEVRWHNESTRIVAYVNYEKFTQNNALRIMLIDTGSKTLAEASPYDRIWGIGFDSSTAIRNMNMWGQNKLGEALMMVRSEFVKSKK